ncbi:MAG: hypothetical protein J07HQW2_00859 [Haloquadratum walsbyi J07HQW2]|uniref:Putative sensor domain-containing protein n=2 Tax=Haloquadratum walsbyi TaxID=293091 RepID=U1NC11_9EURY|nr:MAG: hypothetical protein J07HQW2_00859 [Haloquadratum walsbyi J07HQW2]
MAGDESHLTVSLMTTDLSLRQVFKLCVDMNSFGSTLPSNLPVIGVLVDIRTYKHLLYLVIALPAIFVYSALFSMIVLGIILSVVGIGFIILLAALFATRVVVRFERWLANRLLDTDLEEYGDVAGDTDGMLGSVKKYIEAGSTWRGVGFLSLKSFIAGFAFVPLFVLANGLPLLTAPLRYPLSTGFGEVNGEPVRWSIETLPEAFFAVAIGVAGIVITLHMANLSAYVTQQMTTALLGVGKSTEDDGNKNHSEISE